VDVVSGVTGKADAGGVAPGGWAMPSGETEERGVITEKDKPGPAKNTFGAVTPA
jgi:hypothetical protein